MLSKSILFCCLLFKCYAASPGDLCSKDGQSGICSVIGQCQSAIEEIKHGRDPKICGFNGSIPIVCCFDSILPTESSPFLLPRATTTSSVFPTTTTYEPPVYDYQDTRPQLTGCAPLAVEMTSKKTGQKAFDKCIEYQQKYVYPCEKDVTLTGGMSRVNHCHHNAYELIIGGTGADLHEFPHMVMLGYGKSIKDVQWLCGGTIISDRFILTARHCLQSDELGDVTYVVAGVQTRREMKNRQNIYKVRKTFQYPLYKPLSKYNDIGLLELETPIKLSQYVVPACLVAGEPVDDNKVQATGWGGTQYNGHPSEYMQKVTLQKFTTRECSEKYGPERLLERGFDPETQLCYGDRSRSKDTCQGDSGGPIQIKSKKVPCMYVVVGVTSFGRACGFASEPAIYTRVAHYVPWIESIVWPSSHRRYDFRD